MAAAMASWLFNRSKNTTVKIVYPGGRVEQYDRPIIASQIIQRYPQCCVARPVVFQQTWAVVPADAVLNLGEEFYVVPVTNLKKLPRVSLRNNRHSNYSRSESRDSPIPVIGEERAKNRWCFRSLINGSKKTPKVRDSEVAAATAAAGKMNKVSPRRPGGKNASPSRKGYCGWHPSLASISEE